MLRKLAVASALLFSFSAPVMACPMQDAAEFAEAAKAVESATGTKASFKVEGMSCGDCSAKLTAALSNIEGVEAVAVDYQTGEAKVSFDASKTDAEKLLAVIVATGYAAANS